MDPSPGEAEPLWHMTFSHFVFVLAVALLAARCAQGAYVCRFNGLAGAVQTADGRQMAPEDGSWAGTYRILSRRDTPLGPAGIVPINAVSYRQCGENPEDAQSVRFMEFRDERLAPLIAGRKRLKDRAGEYWRAKSEMDSRLRRELAGMYRTRPDWLPPMQITERTLLGCLDGGVLFRDVAEHRYFWIRSWPRACPEDR